MKKLSVLLVLTLLLGAGLAQTTVRIGLAEDPDILDPALARTYVGRIVFASLCDKLFDISTDLKVVPQLATAFETSDDGLSVTIHIRDGVTFHDGTVLDAVAVKYNLDRDKNLPGSNRASDLAQLESVDVVDDATVLLHLSQPFSPLIAQLTDRAGMMVSPTAAEAAGDDFGNHPVCAGPFKFNERIAQDRIVLDRFADYWNADAIKVDRVVFLPIPDTSVRLANLQAGDLDLIERPGPTDLAAIRADSNLELPSVASLGYQGITINMTHPTQRDNPISKDVRVREAFDLSLDRDVINNVVFDGEYIPGNQAVPPTSPWYVKDYPMVPRDVEKAKALLAEAGYDRVAFELMVSNSPEGVRIGEVVQSMAAEAGFDITVRATEFASALNIQESGDYDAFAVGWSGRTDPDGNIYSFQSCDGNLNETGYCDAAVDDALNRARAVSDPDERFEIYKEAALRYLPDRHIIYTYHQQLFFPHIVALHGFQPFPDGLIRLQGVSID